MLPRTLIPVKAECGYGLAWWFDAVDCRSRARQPGVAGGRGAIPWINLYRWYAAFLLMRETPAAGVAVSDPGLPSIRHVADGR